MRPTLLQEINTLNEEKQLDTQKIDLLQLIHKYMQPESELSNTMIRSYILVLAQEQAVNEYNEQIERMKISGKYDVANGIFPPELELPVYPTYDTILQIAEKYIKFIKMDVPEE